MQDRLRHAKPYRRQRQHLRSIASTDIGTDAIAYAVTYAIAYAIVFLVVLARLRIFLKIS